MANLFRQTEFETFIKTLKAADMVDQWDSRVAKVGGKVFALLTPDDLPRITFKCPEETFVILTAIEGVGQAPYFAKRQWVSVSENSDLPAAELQEYIRRSYGIIASRLTRKLRLELGIE
jgi:Uncharacterized protein conserved in bacteria